MNKYAIIFDLGYEFSTKVVEAPNNRKARKMAFDYLKFKRPKMGKFLISKL